MSSHEVQTEEQMTDPESGWTWFISLASMVILVVTVVVCTVIFFSFEQEELAIKVIDKPAEEMINLRKVQEGVLDKYERYTVIPVGGTEEDAEEQIRIPITKAMEVIVAESHNHQANARDSQTGGTSVVRADGKEAVE